MLHHPPSLRRFFRAETGVFLGVWLALMVLGRGALFHDPGTFWHVRLGRQMIDSHEIVRSDPFSFTRAGRPWVAQQWLAECGMALVDRAAGLDGLLLATATVLAGLFAWVAHRLLRAGFHALPVGTLIALLLMAGAPQFHARPLILTLALLGLTFALLVDVETGRRRLASLAWLVPITAVWANLHAGVMAGLGTFGLVAAGWSATWMLGRESPVRRPRDLLAVGGLLAACCGSVLLNPYGLALPRAWLATLTIPLPELIQEHRPLDISSPLGWAVALLGIGYVLALIGAGCHVGCHAHACRGHVEDTESRPHAHVKRGHGTRSAVAPLRVTWLLPLVWLFLAVTRVRNVPLFAVVAAIAAAEAIPRGRWAGWLRRHEMLLDEDPSAPRPATWHAAVLPLLLIVAVACVQLAGIHAPVVGRGWARLDADHWPVELLPQLEEIERGEPDGTPIFNDLAFGGYLIDRAPRLWVFVDDRCALYGPDFLEQYDHARTADPARLDHWRRQYGFRYAMVESDMPFDRHLSASAEWHLVARTPVAGLYRFDGVMTIEGPSGPAVRH